MESNQRMDINIKYVQRFMELDISVSLVEWVKLHICIGIVFSAR